MNRTRLILLAFCAVLAIFLFQRYFLDPAGQSLRERLETEGATLEKYERVLSKPVTEERVTELRSGLDGLQKGLVQEKTDFLASSVVQSRVTELAGRAGMVLSTLRPVDPAEAGTYRSVGVYFEGSGSIKQLSDFLQSLEKDEVLLKVDRITVNVMNMQNPKDIRIKMQVSALRRA